MYKWTVDNILFLKQESTDTCISFGPIEDLELPILLQDLLWATTNYATVIGQRSDGTTMSVKHDLISDRRTTTILLGYSLLSDFNENILAALVDGLKLIGEKALDFVPVPKISTDVAGRLFVRWQFTLCSGTNYLALDMCKLPVIAKALLSFTTPSS